MIAKGRGNWASGEAHHLYGKRGYHYGKTGEKNPNAKRTSEEVRQIFRFRREGWTQTKIAKYFGMDQTVVSGILRGKNWKEVYAEFN